MYRIINTTTGETIGLTAEPNYIRRKYTGSLVKATPTQAQGIAYKSVPYNLMGRDGVDAETTVLVEEFDVSDLVFQIPDVEDLFCELDINYNNRFDVVEDALCELDMEEKINE